MSEQHTPGPWRIHDEGNGDYAIRAFQGPIQVQPARAFGLKDARLIAAAPELLEALKDLIENTQWALFGPRGNAECTEDEMYGDARAAIAKATAP